MVPIMALTEALSAPVAAASPNGVIVITVVLLVDHATCALGIFALEPSEYTPMTMSRISSVRPLAETAIFHHETIKPWARR